MIIMHVGHLVSMHVIILDILVWVLVNVIIMNVAINLIGSHTLFGSSTMNVKLMKLFILFVNYTHTFLICFVFFYEPVSRDLQPLSLAIARGTQA